MQLLADTNRRLLSNTMLDKKMKSVMAMTAPTTTTTTTATTTQSTLLANSMQSRIQQYHQQNTTTTTAAAAATTTTSPTTTKTTTTASGRLRVREFNEYITCFICNGYLINPTSVEPCAHNFCRSCILKHLHTGHHHCPQCSAEGVVHQKTIGEHHLRADDVLRALIYKLVPGLYHQERERLMQFNVATRNNANNNNNTNNTNNNSNGNSNISDGEEEFFAPTEPISLSLEYHPALLKACNEEQVPPVRYLQCPAGVKIHHLKHFLCSKYGIDPENKLIDVQVMYEDEILRSDFTLMDVGYCYNWQRHAPMKFRYSIVVYDKSGHNVNGDSHKAEPRDQKHLQPFGSNGNNNTNNNDIKDSSKNDVSVVGDDEDKSVSSSPSPPLQAPPTTSPQQTKRQQHINSGSHGKTVSFVDETKPRELKVMLGRRAGSGKRNNSGPTETNSSSSVASTPIPTHDFKSLRSNDMRYSDYTVTSSTTKSSSDSGRSHTHKPQVEAVAPVSIVPVVAPAPTAAPAPAVVVSIPTYFSDDQYENISLAQLKTAAKKSPPQQLPTTGKNVPKLKIELNSLKRTLSVPKPKSANADLADSSKQLPRISSSSSKHRKHSLDECSDRKLDLQSYAKEIGLKPIEVLTPDGSDPFKYSPNASPRSSCSSSTTSSSNGNLPYTTSTSSSHKKRKKKHSKESGSSSRGSSGGSGGSGKRRKLHAEISSQPADESLKMKVKFTATPNHKPHHKLPTTTGSQLQYESKRDNVANTEIARAVDFTPAAVVASVTAAAAKAAATVATAATPSALKHDNKMATDFSVLNKTLGVEAQGMQNALKRAQFSDTLSTTDNNNSSNTNNYNAKVESNNKLDLEVSMSVMQQQQQAQQLQPAKQSQLPSKPLTSIKKEVKLPASPPLPPSLFKTLPLTFPTLTAGTAGSSHKLATPTPLRPTDGTGFSSGGGGNKEAPKLSQPSPPLLSKPVLPSASLKPNAVTPQPAVKATSTAAVTPASPKSQFVVPHPPRSMVAPAQKYFSTPTSIASAHSKQVGLLKRSASLDESLSKRQRLEQDRLARRTAYGAFIGHTQLGGKLAAPYHLQQPPPQPKQQPQLPFYAPTSTAFTQEYVRRKHASILPSNAPSIATSLPLPAAAASTTAAAAGGSTGAVTITSRPRLPNMAPPPHTTSNNNNNNNLLSQQQQQTQGKPDLEIVRITSAPTLATLPPLSPPKAAMSAAGGGSSNTNRLMGPPLSFLKNRKSMLPMGLASSAVKSPPLLLSTTAPSPFNAAAKSTNSISGNNNKCNNINNNSSGSSGSGSNTKPINRSSPPALVNLRNTIPLSFKTNPTPTTSGGTKKIDATTKPKLSLRDFRPLARDDGGATTNNNNNSNGSVLDLSPTAMSAMTAATAKAVDATAATKIGSGPIATKTTNSTNTNNNNNNNNNNSKTNNNNNNNNVNHKNNNNNNKNDDLQNLQLLSESATAREKISIKAPLFEKPKLLQQPSLMMVRQQNASVRNIPNPSALAFRNQQQLTPPLMPSTTTSASTPLSTTSSTPVLTTSPATSSSSSLLTPSAELKKSIPLISSSSSATTTNTSITATTSKLLSTPATAAAAVTPKSPVSPPRSLKKLTSIDQVAANLNIRAAAAEAAAHNNNKNNNNNNNNNKGVGSTSVLLTNANKDVKKDTVGDDVGAAKSDKATALIATTSMTATSSTLSTAATTTTSTKPTTTTTTQSILNTTTSSKATTTTSKRPSTPNATSLKSATTTTTTTANAPTHTPATTTTASTAAANSSAAPTLSANSAVAVAKVKATTTTTPTPTTSAAESTKPTTPTPAGNTSASVNAKEEAKIATPLSSPTTTTTAAAVVKTEATATSSTSSTTSSTAVKTTTAAVATTTTSAASVAPPKSLTSIAAAVAAASASATAASTAVATSATTATTTRNTSPASVLDVGMGAKAGLATAV